MAGIGAAWWRGLSGAFAFALAGIGSAVAHPHVFVTTRAVIVSTPDGIVIAVKHRWTFDEAYSAFLVQGLKTDADGKVAASELAELAKINVESLADFSYFTGLKAAGKEVAFGKPADYRLEPDGKTLTLTFTLPLAAPAPVGRMLTLQVSDPTFFVSFDLAGGEDAVAVENGPPKCKLTVARPKPVAETPLAKLGESFFQGSAASEFGLQFASKILLACP
jgi:ABC-type uncharacterized transport system substrate-binding protein